nr:hypothetical protein CFP56_54910 [Quercus suber]
MRCQKSGRECQANDGKVAFRFASDIQRKPHLSFPSDATAVDNDCKIFLEYFQTFTVPQFCRCEPSPLWSYMLQSLHNDPCVSYLAAAIGCEHRGAMEKSSSTETQTLAIYARAVQSLRTSIASSVNDGKSRVVLACLLLAILQSVRGQFNEMLIHLRSGTLIASDSISRSGGSPDLIESTRLLNKYSMATILFNGLSSEADWTMKVMRSVSQNGSPPSADLDNEQRLLSQLDDMTFDLLNVMQNGRRLEVLANGQAVLRLPDAQLKYEILRLISRQQELELAIDDMLYAPNTTDSARVALSGLAKARCLLSGAMLRCAFSRHQTNYDAEQQTFTQIVDHVQASLTEFEAPARHQVDAPSVFSLGLGAILLLVFVAGLCRDFETRHRAIKTLDLCPRTEGPWTVELARSLCTAIVTFEESKAIEDGGDFALTRWIPEHCRVHWYQLDPSQHPKQSIQRILRLFRRLGDEYSSFVYEDLELKVFG